MRALVGHPSLLRGVVLVAAIMVVGIVAERQDEDWWQASELIALLEPVAAWLHGFIPPDIGA